MKYQNLLLFALFAIFVIQVQATGNYHDYDEFEHDMPDNCEELFDVNNCNKCQSLMWKHFQNPGQCATAFNFGVEIFKAIKDSGETPKPYDLKFFKKGLNSYCSKDFHCNQKEVEKIYNNIQNVCKRELSVKFNWSDDPRTFKDVTAYAAYGTLLTYYTGIPAQKALCIKSNNGDFCSYEFTNKITEWIKKETNADEDIVISHDFKFVIKGDGNKIRIPRKFFCDPCWRKMSHIYVDYIKEHRLKKSVEKNIWGSCDDLDELYLPNNCNNSKRELGDILSEKSEIPELSERSANPAFGILSPRMNKLHSLRF